MKEFNTAIIRVKNDNTYKTLSALRGESSYALAVQNGFEGTEEEWMESIIGDGWVGAFQELDGRTTNLENNFDTLTPSSIGAAVQAHYTAVIGTTWTGNTAPYTQVISVSGIRATDNPIVDIIPSDTFATAKQEMEEFVYIYRLITGVNEITVYATEPTTVPINIHMEVIR